MIVEDRAGLPAENGSPQDARSVWVRFTHQAPDLADAVSARFSANLHHVLATLRADGSPRLSGTELAVGPGAVELGMMAGSRKLADVRRDPRVEVHSAPLEEDLAEGDVKLSGRLVATGAPVASEPGAAAFLLLLERVSHVRVADDHLVITTWDPDRGLREFRRR